MPASFNQHPLNQLARKKLQEAQQRPDPEQVYAVQLMQWALDHGLDDLDPLNRPELAALVRDSLPQWSDQEVEHFLLRPQPEENPEDADTLDSQEIKDLAQQSPQEVAQALLVVVHYQLAALQPSLYPIRPPQSLGR